MVEFHLTEGLPATTSWSSLIFSSENNQLSMRRQLVVFLEEAEGFGFLLERDIRFYMELRLRYPQDAFSNDQEIRSLLGQSDIQRLFDINDRLNQIATRSF